MTAVLPAQPIAPNGLWDAVRQRVTGRLVLTTLTVLLLVYLVIGPVVLLFTTSFQDTSQGIVINGAVRWTTENYGTAFARRGIGALLLTTALFALGSLVIGLVVGLLFAWLLERTDIPGRRFLHAMVIAPMGIPSVVLGVAWSLLLNPSNGAINVWLRSWLHIDADRGPLNAYTLITMIFVQGVSLVPLAFLLLSAGVRNVSSSMEEAARMSGAGLWNTLRRVQLPLLAPAIGGMLVYQFCIVVETTDIPLTLGLPGNVPILSTQTYLALHPGFGLPNYGASSAYGVALLAIAAIPVLLYNRMVSQNQKFTTVTGKSYRANKTGLGRWRVPVFVLALLYIGVTLVLPLLMLAWTSLFEYVRTPSWEAFSEASFTGYLRTFHDPVFLRTLTNTLVIGVTAAVGAMVVSVAASWIITRTRSKVRWLVDVLAFLPHVLPAVSTALAILIVYLILPIPVYGTIWIIVIAMITKYISLGTRNTTTGLLQLHPRLEEAAAMSGASGVQVWRRVLTPLLRPALISGGLLIFLGSVQNLTLPLVLQTSGNSVLSVLIWDKWAGSAGDPAGTAVLGMVTTVITIIVTVALRIFEERGATADR